MVNANWIAGLIGFSPEKLINTLKNDESRKNVNKLLIERFKSSKGSFPLIAFGTFKYYPKKSLDSNKKSLIFVL